MAWLIKKGPVRLLSVSLIMIMPLFATQCKMSYSFSGVNISPETKTVSVQYYQNRAPIVQAQLSQLFTDAMIDKIQANTSLDLIPSQGDIDFSGEIRGYETRPTAITGQEVAARNRLTITVRIKYVNNLTPELDYDTNFSRYEDYDASLNLSDVEDELIEIIVGYLIEDIFNKAFVNW